MAFSIGKAARWLGVAMDIAIMPAAGALVGYFADKYFGTGPILTLVFGFLGVAGAFMQLIKMAKEMQRDSQ